MGPERVEAFALVRPDMEAGSAIAADQLGSMIAVQVERDDSEDGRGAANGRSGAGRREPDVEYRRLARVDRDPIILAVAVEVGRNRGLGCLGRGTT